MRCFFSHALDDVSQFGTAGFLALPQPTWGALPPATAHEELVVVCQVETGQAVDNAEQLAAVDRVDAFLIGPFDLSGSLGHLGVPRRAGLSSGWAVSLGLGLGFR